MVEPSPAHSHSQKDFRVAIVGGGICGLVCAIGLVRAGIQVEIFESASKYGEVGAGVGIGPNAVRVLRYLGLLEDVAASSFEDPPAVRPFKFQLGTSGHATVYNYPARKDDLGLGIYRASFLDALVKFIDPQVTPTHFNKRCIDISVSSAERSPIVLHFSDGTTHETDLVIGADGIKSSVRNFVVHGSSAPYVPTFTNTVAYRGLASIEELVRAGVKTQLTPMPICWMGDSRHIITFPIRRQKVLNVVAFVTDFSLPMGHLSFPLEEPWVVPASKDELLSQFSDWGDDARTVLQFIENPTKWSLHGLYPPLPSFVRGRVALVGDAAHAMLPHLGAGAGQGIEDSYVITRLLAHPQANASNLEAILGAYDRIREPRANSVLQQSKQSGDVYEGHGPSGPSLRERQADLQDLWEDIWHHDIEADIEASVNRLQELQVFVQDGSAIPAKP